MGLGASRPVRKELTVAVNLRYLLAYLLHFWLVKYTYHHISRR
jgi:hypothetical protein